MKWKVGESFKGVYFEYAGKAGRREGHVLIVNLTVLPANIVQTEGVVFSKFLLIKNPEIPIFAVPKKSHEL
jgi:hypothetical protein